MHEPDVTLTDYLLALECAAFCALAARWPTLDGELRRLWILFFASIGIGAALGGTVHGFFPEQTRAKAVLWTATILAIGVTSTVTWILAAQIHIADRAILSAVRKMAVALFVIYALVVLFVTSRFVVAIVAYAPATVFLLLALAVAYRSRPDPALAVGIAGFLLTFVAAAVQQLGIALHRRYFDHNATYHAIQAVALVLILIAARRTVTPPHLT